MNNELKFRKCLKCGAMVKVIDDCKCSDCGITCCGEAMREVKANSTDGAVEKHVPTYEVEDKTLTVRVNHVMEDEHYIEWICLKTEDREDYIYFSPNTDAVAIFENVHEGTLYAYCNKHGLWKANIEK